MHVATGYAKAVAHAKRCGASAIQVFSTNPRSYRTTAIDESALDNFAQMRREAGLDPCVIHTPYLINLASGDPKIAAGSLHLLKNDLAVAARGGMRFVNTHLGSYGDRDRDEAFAAIRQGLESALEGIAPGVSGSRKLGGRGEARGRHAARARLAGSQHRPSAARGLSRHGARLGFGLRDRFQRERRGKFIERAEAEIGLARILMFHFNDTQVELGAGRDRHWHIGEGRIGFEGFRALLAHQELREKTAILETPGSDADDERNMLTILAIERGATTRGGAAGGD